VPAVFVHGSFAWGSDTFPGQRLLADAARVILIDRRGYGGTPRGDAVGWPGDTDDLVALLAELGGAHLVGHSYGGVVALLAAGERPDLVRSLVAVEPPLFGISKHPEAVRITELLTDLGELAPDLTPADYTAAFFDRLTRTDAAELAQWTSSWGSADWAAADSSRAERSPLYAPVRMDVLADLDVPKVVAVGAWPEELAGEATDSGQAFRAVADELHERIHADVVVFDHSLHNPQMSEPKTFNAFLRRVWSAA